MGMMKVVIRESSGSVVSRRRVPLGETLAGIDLRYGVSIAAQDDDDDDSGEQITESVTISETRQDARGSLQVRLDAIDAKYLFR